MIASQAMSGFAKKIALLALLACCASCARADPPKPLLWKVSDADNEIYLLGSFHLLKPTDYPLPAASSAAFEDAEKLVLELSPGELNDPGVTKKMATAAQLRGRTLDQVLPAATWRQLQAYTAKRGIPLANLQGYEPWFVSLLVSLTALTPTTRPALVMLVALGSLLTAARKVVGAVAEVPR